MVKPEIMVEFDEEVELDETAEDGRPPYHPQHFWDALAERAACPKKLAGLLPGYSEFEIAAKLAKARVRVAVRAADARREARSEESGYPPCLRSNFGYQFDKLVRRAPGREPES